MSEATLTCEGGDTSRLCDPSRYWEAIRADVAVEENEIECFAKVFEIDRAEAQGYYFEGQSFRNAVNARVAEYCAEAIEYIDTKNVRRLHKMKQLVMKQAANWTAIRKEHFPCVPSRDADPVGENLASCYELVNNVALLPREKKGCCRIAKGGKAKDTSGKAYT